MTNTAIAQNVATAGATILSFPVRANEGGWDKLFALGAKLTAAGEKAYAIRAFQFADHPCVKRRDPMAHRCHPGPGQAPLAKISL